MRLDGRAASLLLFSAENDVSFRLRVCIPRGLQNNQNELPKNKFPDQKENHAKYYSKPQLMYNDKAYYSDSLSNCKKQIQVSKTINLETNDSLYFLYKTLTNIPNLVYM